MDEHFKKFKDTGKNSVDSLMKWLEECETRAQTRAYSAKLIENTNEAKEKARKLFDDVKNKQDVELEKFKDVVKKLADEQKKNFDDFAKTLAEAVPKVQDAIAKAAATIQETISKK